MYIYICIHIYIYIYLYYTTHAYIYIYLYKWFALYTYIYVYYMYTCMYMNIQSIFIGSASAADVFFCIFGFIVHRIWDDHVPLDSHTHAAYNPLAPVSFQRFLHGS